MLSKANFDLLDIQVADKKLMTIASSKGTHEVFVPRGTTVRASVTASNRNKRIWGDDAYEWNAPTCGDSNVKSSR